MFSLEPDLCGVFPPDASGKPCQPSHLSALSWLRHDTPGPEASPSRSSVQALCAPYHAPCGPCAVTPHLDRQARVPTCQHLFLTSSLLLTVLRA